jgi:RNA polymerase sigma factor (sigma-70 family)
VFLAAHRALLNGTSPREPAAWLATIARNECWARIRTRMREPLPTAEVDSHGSSSDPLADAIRNVDLAAMWAAIADLPRQQRDALLLREFGGLSYAELAGALAVSGSAVESLLFRARQGVRSRLETAYAALTGASWLDSLARLAGSVGGGMAPVAAKVAVVGVSAAVATGGAVVAPRLLDGATGRLAVPETSIPHPAIRVRAAVRAAAPPPARPAQPAPVLVVRRKPRAAVERRRTGLPSEGRGNGSDDQASGGGEGSSDRDSASTDPVDVQAPAETATDGSRHEDPSGKDGGGGSPGGRGSGGSSGSHDEGDATTTANPTVTVTVPSGDDPPSEGGSGPGDDG